LYGDRQVCPSLASTSAQFNTAAIQQYQPGSWQLHTAQGVVLDGSGGAASNTIQYILFYPPDPCMLVSTDDGQTFQSICNNTFPYNDPPSAAYVYLSTANGSMSRTITVNPAGQVSL
jgi:hypothetical protein